MSVDNTKSPLVVGSHTVVGVEVGRIKLDGHDLEHTIVQVDPRERSGDYKLVYGVFSLTKEKIMKHVVSNVARRFIDQCHFLGLSDDDLLSAVGQAITNSSMIDSSTALVKAREDDSAS